MSRRAAVRAELLADEYVRSRHHVAAGVVATDDQSRLAIFRVGARFSGKRPHLEIPGTDPEYGKP